MNQPARVNDLWAITCYFNPVGYHRRRANYHAFRSRLNVPLVTVELALGGAPFVLTEGDAEELIQLRGDSVLWQKERLLNLALEELPESCRKVAWLDCDIAFARPDWARLTSSALEDFNVVQPFAEWVEVTDRETAELFFMNSDPVIHSWARRFASGEDMLAETFLRGTPVERRTAGGSAWAARRDILQQHGLYDACVIGSGDRAIGHAAIGRFEGAIDPMRMNEARAAHYLSWAVPFFERVRGRVGSVEGLLVHFAHGDVRDRRYLERHQDFAGYDFDPATDLAIDSNGCWRWNSEKPEMHRFVAEYFRSRNEDAPDASLERR